MKKLIFILILSTTGLLSEQRFYRLDADLNDYITKGDTIVLAGTSGTVMRSYDNGDTWHQRYSGTQADIYDIVMNEDRLYFVADSGKLAFSDNFGESWSYDDRLSDYHIQSVDAKNNLLVCAGSNAFISKNYGKDFEEYNLYDNIKFVRIFREKAFLFNKNHYYIYENDEFEQHSFSDTNNLNNVRIFNDKLYAVFSNNVYVFDESAKNFESIINTDSTEIFDFFISDSKKYLLTQHSFYGYFNLLRTENNNDLTKISIDSSYYQSPFGYSRGKKIFRSNNRFFVIGDNKSILYSDDVGYNWKIKSFFNSIDRHNSNIFKLNDSTFYFGKSDATIYKTEDCGVTFKPIHFGKIGFVTNITVTGIRHFDENNGFYIFSALKDWETGTLYNAIKIKNGNYEYFSTPSHLVSDDLADENTYYFNRYYDRGVYLYKSDKALEIQKTLRIDSIIPSFYHYNGDEIIVSGQNWDNPRKAILEYSFDGGDSFTRKTFDDYNSLLDFYKTKEGRIYFIFLNSYESDGDYIVDSYICYTDTYWDDYEIIQEFEKINLSKFHMRDDDYGFISSRTGELYEIKNNWTEFNEVNLDYKDSKFETFYIEDIEYTDDFTLITSDYDFLYKSVEKDSSTSVQDYEVESFSSIYLHEAYPNPFSNRIRLEFEFDRSNNPKELQAKIYDLNGIKIAEPEDFSISEKGVSYLDWVPDNTVDSGIYIISVELKGIVKAKKVVYLKN